jgi:hypothetical protein
LENLHNVAETGKKLKQWRKQITSDEIDYHYLELLETNKMLIRPGDLEFKQIAEKVREILLF